MAAEEGVPAVPAEVAASPAGGGDAGPTLADFVSTLKQPKIIGLCGSDREGSYNKMLLEAAVTHCTAAGGVCEVVDLAALSLPLYSSQLEGEDVFPASAKELKAKLVGADGIIITCPEFNGGITPLLCNAITWATRGEGGMYDGFKGKCITVMATSPGPMGGIRMVRSLQQMMMDMGGVVIPGHCSVGGAMKVFDADGKIVDERSMSKVKACAGQLVHFARFEANRAHDCQVFEELMKLQNMGEYGSTD